MQLVCLTYTDQGQACYHVGCHIVARVQDQTLNPWSGKGAPGQGLPASQ
jgi:hypothetical protein